MKKKISEKEQWLHKNPKALASVQKGIKQSANGETAKLPFNTWGSHPLENNIGYDWSRNAFREAFQQIENTALLSKDFHEVRIAAFWLLKLGQWFEDRLTLADVVKGTVRRLKVFLEDEEILFGEIDLNIKNATKEEISLLQRFEKQLREVNQ